MGKSLYEINQEIENALEQAVDMETGELLSDAAYNAYQNLLLERDVKIENIGLFIKNLKAEHEAVKAEKMSFAKRQQSLENKIEWLKNYLTSCLGAGEKFKTERLSISWRKSQQVQIDDATKLSDEFVIIKQDFNKSLIAEKLKAGEEVDGASLVENNNIQIK